MRTDADIIERWTDFYSNQAVDKSLFKKLNSLPDRSRVSFARWEQTVDRIIFWLSTRAVKHLDSSYYESSFLVQFFQFERFRITELREFEWNPNYWMKELFGSFQLILLSEKLESSQQKQAILSRLSMLPKYLEESKFWLKNAKLSHFQYDSLVMKINCLGLTFQAFKKSINKLDEDRDSKEIFSASRSALIKFGNYLKSKVSADSSLSFSVQFSKQLRYYSGLTVDELYKNVRLSLMGCLKQYRALEKDFLLNQSSKLAEDESQDFKNFEQIIHKHYNFETYNELIYFVPDLYKTVKDLLEHNSILSFPTQRIIISWSPLFYLQEHLVEAYSDPFSLNQSLNFFFIRNIEPEDKFFNLEPVNRVTSEIDFLKRLIPGEYVYREYKSLNETSLSKFLKDSSDSKAWGYFILDYLFNLGYRGEDVEFQLIYRKKKLELLFTVISEILLFVKKKSQQEVLEYLLESNIFSIQKAKQILSNVYTSFGSSSLIFAGVKLLKRLQSSWKGEQNKLLPEILKNSHLPLRILVSKLEQQFNDKQES